MSFTVFTSVLVIIGLALFLLSVKAPKSIGVALIYFVSLGVLGFSGGIAGDGWGILNTVLVSISILGLVATLGNVVLRRVSKRR